MLFGRKQLVEAVWQPCGLHVVTEFVKMTPVLELNLIFHLWLEAIHSVLEHLNS